MHVCRRVVCAQVWMCPYSSDCWWGAPCAKLFKHKHYHNHNEKFKCKKDKDERRTPILSVVKR